MPRTLVAASGSKRWFTGTSIHAQGYATDYLSVKNGKLLSFGNNFFHVDWLRHNCQCDHCQDSMAGQRNVDASDLKDLSISSAIVKGKHSCIAMLTYRTGMRFNDCKVICIQLSMYCGQFAPVC